MTAPTEASLLCFLLGCEEGTFCWWWIMSLSHEVKVKHTHSGGVLHWMYMDHLKWNQFCWKITAGCHNGFIWRPSIPVLICGWKSNLVRTEWVKKMLYIQISDHIWNKCSRWHLLIHPDNPIYSNATHFYFQPKIPIHTLLQIICLFSAGIELLSQALMINQAAEEKWGCTEQLEIKLFVSIRYMHQIHWAQIPTVYQCCEESPQTVPSLLESELV